MSREETFPVCETGNLNSLKTLLKLYGPTITKDTDETGRTLLLVCAAKGHQRIARVLLKAGADSNHNDVIGNTALMLGAFYGHNRLVKILLQKENNVNITQKNVYDETALILAAKYGRKEIVELLIAADNSPDHLNLKDSRGYTAEQIADFEGYDEIREFLFQQR